MLVTKFYLKCRVKIVGFTEGMKQRRAQNSEAQLRIGVRLMLRYR
jgi:hypothetical protein